MSAEAVMRTVGVLTCATTLSLFSTIVAYAAVNVAPLRWDGSMCTANKCGAAVSMIDDRSDRRMRVARIGSTF